MTKEELLALRDELWRARLSGAQSVKAGEQQVTYRSDAEIAAALAEIERLIAALDNRSPIRAVRVFAKKGL